MTPALVVSGYREGIFPWSADPVMWFSPDPRALVALDEARLPRNLGKIARKRGFSARLNTRFAEVMQSCREAHRAEGEWITQPFVDSYSALAHAGAAHSIEVFQKNTLVGGLYGVQVGRMFAGESMFHTVSDASKVAFALTVLWLRAMKMDLFDVQVLNDFTESLGARNCSRQTFLNRLTAAAAAPAPPLQNSEAQFQAEAERFFARGES